jgi:hypothetical protein
MRGRVSCLGVILPLLIATADVTVAQNATTGAAAEIANRMVDKNGLGLTPQQAGSISESVRSEREQPVPAGASVEIGRQVPDSMMLIELPVEVKDRIGSLRDFKFARLQSDKILLVDPTSRVIVDIIPKR